MKGQVQYSSTKRDKRRSNDTPRVDLGEQKLSFPSYLGWFLLFKFSIELVYRYSLVPTYEYYGLRYTPDFNLAILALLFQVTLVAVAPREKDRPSTFLFTLLLLFIFYPALSYLWLASASSAYASFLWICGVVMALILRAVKMNPTVDTGAKSNNKSASTLLLLLFVGYVLGSIAIIGLRGGIDPRAFAFDQIYELRAENSLTGISSYLYNVATKAFFPFFLGYFLTRRRSRTWRYSMAGFVVCLQLIYYLAFGFKAFLFSIFFAALIAIAMHCRQFFAIVIGGISTITSLSLLAKTFPILEIARDTVAFRSSMHPAQIQYMYYDWFNQHDYLLFAETSIGKAIGLQSQYPDGITFHIGRMFTGHSNVNAVTGIFSDAFANGGYAVMLITAILAGILLLIIDFAGRHALILTTVSMSYFMFTLNDTPLTTSLITGGFIFLLALVLIERASVKGS